MSVIINGNELRDIALGRSATKSYTLAVETAPLFTVTGGLVLVTSLVGRVTTAITTAATTVQLQANPTTGTTTNISAASADIGTTDTVAGELLSVTLTPADAVTIGAKNTAAKGFIVETGAVQQVTVAGVTGVIKWYITWIPIDAGAALVAA